MKGDDCSVCGVQLYSKERASFYEITRAYMSRRSSGEFETVFPETMHEYFCSEACLVKFVRERIEPDVVNPSSPP
jgi:hypothetical protein